MIFIRFDEETGYRSVNNGSDGPEHGNQMIDQYIAILMGWALGIDEGKIKLAKESGDK